MTSRLAHGAGGQPPASDRATPIFPCGAEGGAEFDHVLAADEQEKDAALESGLLDHRDDPEVPSSR